MSTGSTKDPGILPRALELVFRHINGRLYEPMDLKPYLNSDVQKLDPDQLRMERSVKTSLFSMLKEVRIQKSHDLRKCFFVKFKFIIVLTNVAFNMRMNKDASYLYLCL